MLEEESSSNIEHKIMEAWNKSKGEQRLSRAYTTRRNGPVSHPLTSMGADKCRPWKTQTKRKGGSISVYAEWADLRAASSTVSVNST